MLTRASGNSRSKRVTASGTSVVRASGRLPVPIRPFILPRVILRVSRTIQEPRAQSVLQAFLDAATARSMTGWVRAARVKSERLFPLNCPHLGIVSAAPGLLDYLRRGSAVLE